MPRLSIQQTNFTAGEITPKAYGRTDIDRYGNGAKTLLNAYPLIYGGARRREGTRYVASTKGDTADARLIPYVFNRDTSYMVELGFALGAGYLRIRDIDGTLVVDVASPYTAAQVPAIDYAQSEATLIFTHVAHAPRRLIKNGATWQFDVLPLVTPALTPDAAVSTSATLTPTVKGAPGSLVTLHEGAVQNATMSVSPNAPGTATITSSPGVFAAGDVGKFVYADTGVALITAFGSATSVTATVTTAFLSATYPANGWALEFPNLAPNPGDHIRINGGLLKVVAVINTTAFTAEVVEEMTSIVTAMPLSWELLRPSWSSTLGWPKTCTFHEQRLIFAGSTSKPQTVWGSRTAEYFDFTPGVRDADGFSFDIASDEVEPINFISSNRSLLIFTSGAEYSMQGGVERPITPTNVRVRQESAHGCRDVRVVNVGKEVVYVQRAGRKVRAMSFDYSVDGYRSPDLMLMAEHLAAPAGVIQGPTSFVRGGRVVSLTFRQEPNPMLWAVRDDGALLSCTFDRDQNVIAWARHATDGVVLSAATIPAGDRDDTWLIVRRTLPGVGTVHYIEALDDRFDIRDPAFLGEVVTNYGFTVDAGKAYYSPVLQTVFAVGHLAGRTVDVIADGFVVSPRPVVNSSGNVTLPEPAKTVLIGLPFRTEITTLTPEVGTGTGTAQASSMRTSEVTLRLHETPSAKVVKEDGTEQALDFEPILDETVDNVLPMFSGLKRIERWGWARGKCEVTIVQDQPLPLHVLSVVQKFQVNDG